MARPAIGDSVNLDWDGGRLYTAIVTEVGPLSVWLRVSGPIEITMIVPLADLSEIGPNRWALNM